MKIGEHVTGPRESRSTQKRNPKSQENRAPLQIRLLQPADSSAPVSRNGFFHERQIEMALTRMLHGCCGQNMVNPSIHRA
jgi:hypothetical protein